MSYYACSLKLPRCSSYMANSCFLGRHSSLPRPKCPLDTPLSPVFTPRFPSACLEPIQRHVGHTNIGSNQHDPTRVTLGLLVSAPYLHDFVFSLYLSGRGRTFFLSLLGASPVPPFLACLFSLFWFFPHILVPWRQRSLEANLYLL